MCWIKSEKAAELSNPIFMGDFNTTGVDKKNRRILFYVKGRFCMVFQGNDLKTKANTVEIGTWYHVAFVYDMKRVERKIVVNG